MRNIEKLFNIELSSIMLIKVGIFFENAEGHFFRFN